MRHRFFISMMAGLALAACSSHDVLIETERFDDLGGWTLDEQFRDQVGSAYLLAHGMGIPVADAKTIVTLPSAGNYHVWVRTYNWNAPWDPSLAPGLFQIAVDGKAVGDKLGDEPQTWGWQYAGDFKAEKKTVSLSLHDLTGFEGRCDAVLITRSDRPSFPEKRSLTPITKEKETYDLIVAGGGTAGISAAAGAARQGLKVLLLDDKPWLGGVGSPAVKISVSGRCLEGRYPKMGRIISEYGRPYRDPDAFLDKFMGEGVDLRLNCRVIEVKKKGDRITSVIAEDYSAKGYVEFKGRYFADCTGDANLGFLAGAEYMMGPETRDVYGEDLAPETDDRRTYGSSMVWNADRTGEVTSFPVLPWAVQMSDSTRIKAWSSAWSWEVGWYRDQIEDGEWMRDYMLKVIYGNWSYLKNSPETAEEFADVALKSVSPFLGKRESRRLRGDYVITQHDIEGGWTRHEDAAVWATYPIDQHFPAPESVQNFPDGPFIATMKHNHNPIGIGRARLVQGRDYNDPYMIPYRCLYSVNVSNMFMAGRDISGSRIALCSYRVMGTCAQMGEVVALAAKICSDYGCTPREVYSDHLQELIAALEQGLPEKYELTYSPD